MVSRRKEGQVISYSKKHFSRRELQLLEVTEKIVPLILDNGGPGGSHTRCHEVARIVEHVLKSAGHRVWVQDGLYGYCDHTWLWTSRPDSDWLRQPDCPNILDPYCVGSLPQVRLVDCSATALPHFGMMYQARSPRTDILSDWVASEGKKLARILGPLIRREKS